MIVPVEFVILKARVFLDVKVNIHCVSLYKIELLSDSPLIASGIEGAIIWNYLFDTVNNTPIKDVLHEGLNDMNHLMFVFTFRFE